MKTSVAIIGYGWVGKFMKELFPHAVVYDPKLKMGSKKEVNKCEIAFICVPTPNQDGGEGRLDTSIVEESLKWCECPLLVIRSTVNPGDCQKWEFELQKKICMQPEYLGETVAHPLTDPKARPFLVIGGDWRSRRKLIDLYMTVYNANINIRQVSNYAAEIIKMTENRAIAFKVAQCQELYDVCEVADVDYYTVREVVYGDDPRFDFWWSAVYPDKRGMNSKCIPKDVYAWCAWAESMGYEPKITRAILEKNKEWIKLEDKGN